MQVRTYQFSVEDVEYLRHGDAPLLARIFTPDGPGPFPAVVELHGGCWCGQDRTRCKNLHEALARTGIVVVALEFRSGQGGIDPYPRSVADINYAIRWVKAHAADLKTQPDLVALSGQSSGGHLAMLVAMRPHDPRYAAIALPPGLPDADASVACVNLLWPVINPPGRYRHAKELTSSDKPAGWIATVAQHDMYWGSVAAMVEASPLEILQRNEKVSLPPALWVQPKVDALHVYHDPASADPATDDQKFAVAYRKAGGDIDMAYYDAPAGFTTDDPTLPQSIDAFERIARFFHAHLPVGQAEGAMVK